MISSVIADRLQNISKITVVKGNAERLAYAQEIANEAESKYGNKIEIVEIEAKPIPRSQMSQDMLDSIYRAEAEPINNILREKQAAAIELDQLGWISQHMTELKNQLSDYESRSYSSLTTEEKEQFASLKTIVAFEQDKFGDDAARATAAAELRQRMNEADQKVEAMKGTRAYDAWIRTGGSSTLSVSGSQASDSLSSTGTSSISGVSEESASQTLLDELSKWARMSPAERIRANYLEDHELTEDDLKAMTDKDRAVIEDEIKAEIERQTDTAEIETTRSDFMNLVYAAGLS